MQNLLFNANGRIQRNRYWQGMVILTVVSVLVVAATAMLSQFLGILAWLVIYPYICVHGKRLHDAGTTAWWVIGIFFGSLVLNFIFGLLLGPMFMDADALAIQQEIAERMSAGDLQGVLEGAEILGQKLLPLNIVSVIGANAILALIVGSLATEPRANKHGPVPGAAHGDTFG